MKSSFPVLTMICGLLLLPHSAFTETKSQAKEREQADQQRLQRKVTKVLQGERMGVIPDRQKALKTLIDSGNAPDEAYWQAGYIKKGDQWVSVEQRWLDREEEAKLDEYANVRNPAWNTPEANYELAKWCDQHGLHEQARAHLMSILLDHPDNAQLRQMLGYQKIGNRWMNEAEFNAAVEAAERLAKNLQKWGPVVAEIRAGLDSGDTRRQNAAKVKLEQIDNPDAVPSMEQALMGDSLQSVTACVKQLSAIKHRDATLALCRAAMFLPERYASVKTSAIEELKNRPLDEFVTTLLTETASPMSYQASLIRNKTPQDNLEQFVIQLTGSHESYLTNEQYIYTHLTSITKTTGNVVAAAPAGTFRIKEWLFTPGDREDRERTQRILNDSIRSGEKTLN
ncbi:MAG TPA: hypothetical protein VLA12_19955, partial [Planctomycetaceae bacterium]|nr:hypothetical protein [Planctomycetaceae bacterium]